MLKNALLSLAALLLMLAAGEVALALLGEFPPSPRLYPGDKPIGTYEHEDPRIGWKLPPGSEIRSAPSHGDFDVTYRADELGFRAPPAPPGTEADPSVARVVEASTGAGAPPEAERRIAFLGDSFTFGVGVEADETFVHLVDRRLAGGRALNFGMSGFGIDQMWLTLRHYAARTEPDIVVLTFVLDDLNRTMAAYRLRDTLEYRRSRGEIGWVPKPAFDLTEDGTLVPLDEASRPGGLARALRRHSRILEGLVHVEHRLAQRFPVGHRWRLNRRVFEEVRDEAERLGAQLLVVYIPSKGLENEPIPLFETEFAGLRIPFLDLQAHLSADAPELYFEHDAHLNAAGHAFVAGRILQAFEERGWAR